MTLKLFCKNTLHCLLTCKSITPKAKGYQGRVFKQKKIKNCVAKLSFLLHNLAPTFEIFYMLLLKEELKNKKGRSHSHPHPNVELRCSKCHQKTWLRNATHENLIDVEKGPKLIRKQITTFLILENMIPKLNLRLIWHRNSAQALL